MDILENTRATATKDPGGMLASISLLPEQTEQAWQETKKIIMPEDYRGVEKVIVNGMGGSGLAAHVISSLFFKELKTPLLNIHSYELPGVVDEKTLYIVLSYSGDTEEPLATIAAAKLKKAKITAISQGGRLGAMLTSKKIPGYFFSPISNPSGQPRTGLGYSIGGIMGLLNNIGLINLEDETMDRAIAWQKKISQKYGLGNKKTDNRAKRMALTARNKLVVVVAAEFLSGNAHILANQINENAKNFAVFFTVPELNHHLLEGLLKPKSKCRGLHFIFLESELYRRENRKRCAVTREILKRLGIGAEVYLCQGPERLAQAFEILSLGSYASYYLGLLNRVEPAAIPFVDYFKKRMSRPA